MLFKFRQLMNLEEKTKCPPGYKYDPKSKMCVDKNAERVARYRPYFGRYLTTKQEQPPKRMVMETVGMEMAMVAVATVVALNI